jgi:hypothetical protein
MGAGNRHVRRSLRDEPIGKLFAGNLYRPQDAPSTWSVRNRLLPYERAKTRIR